ncbi:MAG: hypothetical protein JJU34_06790 [Lunatimonas sp.]|nr:hypothetical protein [Lunatimonas sp.]
MNSITFKWIYLMLVFLGVVALVLFFASGLYAYLTAAFSFGIGAWGMKRGKL